MGHKPLVVLQIIAGFAVEGPLGGIERFVIQLAQAFDRARVQPVVCGLWDFGTSYEREWLARLRRQGISAFIAAPWQGDHPYRAFWKAVQGIVAQQRRVDILHSHHEFGDVAAILVKGVVGAQHVLRTVHNEKEWPKRRLRRWLLSQGLWVILFDHEFGVSRQVVANLNARPLARLLRKRSTVAYNSIDFSRFNQPPYPRQEISRLWGIPPTDFLLMSVGRLTTQKGYEVLLNAMRYILDARQDVHLVVIGTGPLEKSLRARAREMGLASQVHFVGVRRDIERLLPLADVFISSSLWEGLPTAVLEACAAKVPVVATRVSGSTEIIASEDMGLLVPPGRSEPLARAILHLLVHRDEARRMAEKAYDHVQTHFSIQAVARQYEMFYRDLRAT